jgi:two-component system, LuxR family, response regulator FixJ
MPSAAASAPDENSSKELDGTPSAEPVCVVDDDEAVRDSLRIMLESAGFFVLTYASGREFLADEQGRRAACLIIDQHMTEMDGLTTVGALYQSGPKVPAILITGRLDAQIAARTLELGVIAVLEKPFPAMQLLDLVRTSRG